MLSYAHSFKSNPLLLIENLGNLRNLKVKRSVKRRNLKKSADETVRPILERRVLVMEIKAKYVAVMVIIHRRKGGGDLVHEIKELVIEGM